MTLPIEGAAGLAGTLIDEGGGGHCEPLGRKMLTNGGRFLRMTQTAESSSVYFVD
jgi:hypothetical protein